jgi:hypothetical protein
MIQLLDAFQLGQVFIIAYLLEEFLPVAPLVLETGGILGGVIQRIHQNIRI